MEYLIAFGAIIGVWIIARVYLYHTYTTAQAFKNLGLVRKNRPAILFGKISSEIIESAYENINKDDVMVIKDDLKIFESHFKPLTTTQDRINFARSEITGELINWMYCAMGAQLNTVEEMRNNFDPGIIDLEKFDNSEKNLEEYKARFRALSYRSFLTACSMRSFSYYKTNDACQDDWFFALVLTKVIAVNTLKKNFRRNASMEDKLFLAEQIINMSRVRYEMILKSQALSDFSSVMPAIVSDFATFDHYLKAS